MKEKYIIGSLLVSILMLATPTFSAVINQNTLEPPVIKPLGAFQIIIHPPDEPIIRNETIELIGSHQLIPGVFDQFLPSLWAAQYSTLEIDKCPDWLATAIISPQIFTMPTGEKFNFTIQISLKENAPMNSVGTLGINIKTGRYMRTLFPSWFFLCNEYNLDQEILIRTGEW